MTKSELEALLKEYDEALVAAFPGPEPMSVLLVAGVVLAVAEDHHSADRLRGGHYFGGAGE
jgi:hypothetical protein